MYRAADGLSQNSCTVKLKRMRRFSREERQQEVVPMTVEPHGSYFQSRRESVFQPEPMAKDRLDSERSPLNGWPLTRLRRIPTSAAKTQMRS
jgi:hypothetical protein